MLSVAFIYCHTERHYAGCRYAECHYTVCTERLRVTKCTRGSLPVSSILALTTGVGPLTTRSQYPAASRTGTAWSRRLKTFCLLSGVPLAKFRAITPAITPVPHLPWPPWAARHRWDHLAKASKEGIMAYKLSQCTRALMVLYIKLGRLSLASKSNVWR